MSSKNRRFQKPLDISKSSFFNQKLLIWKIICRIVHIISKAFEHFWTCRKIFWKNFWPIRETECVSKFEKSETTTVITTLMFVFRSQVFDLLRFCGFAHWNSILWTRFFLHIFGKWILSSLFYLHHIFLCCFFFFSKNVSTHWLLSNKAATTSFPFVFTSLSSHPHEDWPFRPQAPPSQWGPLTSVLYPQTTVHRHSPSEPHASFDRTQAPHKGQSWYGNARPMLPNSGRVVWAGWGKWWLRCFFRKLCIKSSRPHKLTMIVSGSLLKH